VLRSLHTRSSRAAVPLLLKQAFPSESVRAELHGVEHHLAHLSSAFYVSPFDRSAVASIDGSGIFRARRGGQRRDVKSGLTAEYIFLIHSAHFIRRLRNIWAFPVTAMNSR
jgi:carbamoyltransferase